MNGHTENLEKNGRDTEYRSWHLPPYITTNLLNCVRLDPCTIRVIFTIDDNVTLQIFRHEHHRHKSQMGTDRCIYF